MAPPKKPAKKSAPKKASPKKSASAKPPKATTKVTAKKVIPESPESIAEVLAGDLDLVLISVSASELIPTGDYANVTVGPCTATRYVRVADDDELAEKMNDLAELVEVGVVAEQRELVLSSLQNAASE